MVVEFQSPTCTNVYVFLFTSNLETTTGACTMYIAENIGGDFLVDFKFLPKLKFNPLATTLVL